MTTKLTPCGKLTVLITSLREDTMNFEQLFPQEREELARLAFERAKICSTATEHEEADETVMMLAEWYDKATSLIHCPKCQGVGYFAFIDGEYLGVQCATCKGKGKVPKEKVTK